MGRDRTGDREFDRDPGLCASARLVAASALRARSRGEGRLRSMARPACWAPRMRLAAAAGIAIAIGLRARIYLLHVLPGAGLGEILSADLDTLRRRRLYLRRSRPPFRGRRVSRSGAPAAAQVQIAAAGPMTATRVRARRPARSYQMFCSFPPERVRIASGRAPMVGS